MTRTFTCIVCPNGCEITAEYEGARVGAITGATCPKGEDYVRQELTDPRRTIATSVPVDGGELPLVSVRLNRPVPKKDIFRVMEPSMPSGSRPPSPSVRWFWPTCAAWAPT